MGVGIPVLQSCDDPMVSVLVLRSAVNDTVGVVFVREFDDMVGDEMHAGREGAQHANEVFSEGRMAEMVATDLHILDEQGNHVVHVARVQGKSVPRGKLTDLLLCLKTFHPFKQVIAHVGYCHGFQAGVNLNRLKLRYLE